MEQEICTYCKQPIEEDHKKVQFEAGWMHYYSCTQKGKSGFARPSKFVTRVEGSFVPNVFVAGLRWG